jgi:hypothetical protein
MLIEKKTMIITGLIGLLASVLVGVGEFLLHFDTLARYHGGYDFFEAVTESHATQGHFIAVLAAPLYLFGVWHIYKMLQPASRFWSGVAFFVMSYGFIVGAIWIGSRSSAAALVAAQVSGLFTCQITCLTPTITDLLISYDLRYESLLAVIRITALVFSIIYSSLIMTGRTAYPRWMALFNPIVLIITNFLIFYLAPEIGKYLMPIALNVSFFIIFAISLFIVINNHKQVTHG